MKNVQSAQSPFTMAITSYALALVDLDHHSARSAFSALKKEASVIGIIKFSQSLYCSWLSGWLVF